MRTRYGLALLVLGLGLGACASGPRGVNTGNRMPWTGDCGVSVEVPTSIPTLHGAFVGANSILLAAEEIPPGGLGVLDKQECLGALPGGKTEMRKQPSIDVVRLVEEPIEAAPAAGVPVTKKRFRMDPIRPELWPRR